MGSGVRLEKWLRWFVFPFGGVLFRGYEQYSAFALSSSEVTGEFFILLYLVVHNLPQLHMHSYF